MIKKISIPVLISIPVISIQLVIIPMIAVDEISPNLLVIALVIFTLRNNQIVGSLLGFIVGFLFDIFSGGLIGASMFSLTLAGFVAGYFCKENEIDTERNLLSNLLIVFLSSLIASFIYSTLTSDSSNNIMTYYLFELGVLPGFYTAVVSLPVFVTLNNFSVREI